MRLAMSLMTTRCPGVVEYTFLDELDGEYAVHVEYEDGDNEVRPVVRHPRRRVRTASCGVTERATALLCGQDLPLSEARACWATWRSQQWLGGLQSSWLGAEVARSFADEKDGFKMKKFKGNRGQAGRGEGKGGCQGRLRATGC